MKKLYTLALAVFLVHFASAQLMVNNLNHTPQELVEAIFNGEDVDISNVSFLGDSTQFSFFRRNNSVVPLDSGLVMVTGYAPGIIGEFSGSFNGVVQNDPDLMAIAGQNINDAAIVEFDITVYADTLRFFYSFGSMEYAGYTCSSYNDPFALLISGPGISGSFSNNSVNLATIPGTQTPVSINTVNSGVASPGGFAANCADANPNWVADSIYFIENNPPQDNCVFTGFTVRLEAKTAVAYGQTYHIKMAVGDAADGVLDSGVFLEARTGLGPCLDWGALTGTVFEDENNNGTANPGELRFANKLIQSESSGSYAFTDQNGQYFVCEPLLQGNISLPEVPLYYSAETNPIPFEFETEGGTETANFILSPTGNFSDLTVHNVQSSFPPSPGFTYRIHYNFQNVGTACIATGAVSISPDTNLTFLGSDLAGLMESEGTLAAIVDELCPQEMLTFYVDYLVDQNAPLDSVISTTASITFDGTDETPLNNTYTYQEVIVGSFDPNDKLVSDALIDPDFIASGKKLDYTIRFMNTGTAPAHDVEIDDVLPIDQLDLSTLEFVGASHPDYTVELHTDTLRVRFGNIMLPDSGADFLGSQGYISFRVAPYGEMQVNESIFNSGAIYFDFNEPVITNVVSTTLIESTGIAEADKNRFMIYPNPNKSGVLSIAAETEFTAIKIFNTLGSLVWSQSLSGNKASVNVPGLDSGIYFIQLIGDHKQNLGIQKFVKY